MDYNNVAKEIDQSKAVGKTAFANFPCCFRPNMDSLKKIFVQSVLKNGLRIPPCRPIHYNQASPYF